MNYSQKTLEDIRLHIKKGGLIAFPTESFYGIGCDPKNFKAIRKLLLLKNRSSAKGLIVISNRITDINQIADISSSNVFDKFSSHLEKHNISYKNTRAISFVVNSNPTTLPILTGNRDTIAFRIIDNMQSIAQICSIMPKRIPIIATSANISGKIAHKDYNNVMRTFKGNKHILILKGHGKFFKKTSKIINLLDEAIIRD